ncbi:MAG: MGMT family protein [Ekhidna sp.]|nr:MGMT family protein [Ekhidna sp.]MBC6409394.1 MGMT family protein [Ekhidna sp.]
MDKESFFQDVYEVARLIPKGRVTTYGAIANYLGVKSAARVVGWAMNGAITIYGIPAHRVVNRIGILTGKNHFATPTVMQELLEKEGVKVKDDQVLNFDQILWDPMKELRL